MPARDSSGNIVKSEAQNYIENIHQPLIVSTSTQAGQIGYSGTGEIYASRTGTNLRITPEGNYQTIDNSSHMLSGNTEQVKTSTGHILSPTGYDPQETVMQGTGYNPGTKVQEGKTYVPTHNTGGAYSITSSGDYGYTPFVPASTPGSQTFKASSGVDIPAYQQHTQELNIFQKGALAYSNIESGASNYIKGFAVTKYYTTAVELLPAQYSGIGIGGFGIGSDFFKGLNVGILESPVNRPVTTAISAGLGFGVPWIAGGIETAFPVVSNYGSYIGLGLTGIYGASVGYRGIMTASTTQDLGKTGIEMGSIIGSEIIPGGAGGYLGTKSYYNFLADSSRTEIPFNKISPPEVVRGETGLVLGGGGAKGHLSYFENSPYNFPITKLNGYSGTGELIYPNEYQEMPFKVSPGGYHATSQGRVFEKQNILVTEGASEYKGIYIAPGVAAGFTGTEASSGFSFKNIFKSFNIFPGKPGIEYIQPTRFEMGREMTQTGVAYVPGTKAEAEAVIIPTTNLLKTSEGYVTKLPSGVNVNIETFQSEGGTYNPNFKSRSYTPTKSDVIFRGSFYVSKPSVSSSFSKTSPSKSYIKSSSISNNYSPYSLSKSSTSISSTTISTLSFKSSISSSIKSFSSSFSSSFRNFSSSTTSTPTFSFPNLNMGSLDLSQRRKKIKGKRKYKYTPSYESFVFNIRGKQPRGTEMGTRIRPITKGFSFSSKLKF
jgi:hypothetical protein